MKKTLFAISAIAVLLGFTACTSENEIVEPQVNGKTITIKASTEMPNPSTRTMLDVTNGSDDAGYPVLWTAGDKIKIANEITYSEFTLKNDDANQSTGEFTGAALPEGTYTAYYPFDYDGTWPTAQTYEANNIPLGSPMKATDINVDADGNVDPIFFKNEGGILRLNLMGTAKVKSITISATGLNAITLDCGTGEELNMNIATPFHIAVLGADEGTDYSGLKIEITNDAGAVCTKTLKSENTITVQRSMITDITLTAGNFVATTGTEKRTGDIDVNWVQLWENGPKFAEYNVGATSVTEYGGYYTWGGTYANGEGITWNDDHNNNLEGSITGEVVLPGTDDTATNLWGDKWRMPTKEEFDNLLAKCDVKWDNTNKGLLCTGKGAYSSNSVFLPAAGYCYKSNVVGQGYCGYYWSSTPKDTSLAFYLYFESYQQEVDDVSRDGGFSVRAVLNENQ